MQFVINLVPLLVEFIVKTLSELYIITAGLFFFQASV